MEKKGISIPRLGFQSFGLSLRTYHTNFGMGQRNPAQITNLRDA